MKGLPERGKKQNLPEMRRIASKGENNNDDQDALLSFSFRYFKQSPSEFNIAKKDTQYFLKVLERLSLLSTYTVAELKQCGNKTLRCHKIEWERTSQKNFGLPDEELVSQAYHSSAYQRISMDGSWASLPITSSTLSGSIIAIVYITSRHSPYSVQAAKVYISSKV